MRVGKRLPSKIPSPHRGRNTVACPPCSDPSLLQSLREKPPFDPLARPGRFPQKREAGLHAWGVEETADRDATPHLGPPMPRNQLADDGRQRDPVQRIAGMGEGRWLVHAVSAQRGKWRMAPYFLPISF